ncbi:MAG: SUMF1/EgtB/PvdO family nonheme iron enzyme, partial [Candidatus Obscuribacterales bacterium]|nr:SUMF1/EgtB/PvdO family nonheme iron enzyme [Candidatus Obscuribacterales bacterium]
ASNGEYWHFVSDGGYEKPEYWTETGWRWRSFRNVKHPTFWVPVSNSEVHQYKLRTCFEIVPMQWNWPVVVNFHEAVAFSKWKSAQDGMTYRLLSEAEHHALRASTHADGDEQRWVPPSPANTNLRWGAESPVDAALTDKTSVADVFGNVWQWCEDPSHPLEGFLTHPLYADFSTPCFDGEHQMILGGSFVSTGDEASSWARFHFRPHFFQHAGIRLITTL